MLGRNSWGEAAEPEVVVRARARGPDGIFRSTGMLSLGTRINGTVYARRAQRRRGGRDGRTGHVRAAGAKIKVHQRAVLLRQV